jgi:L-iditol 2-dehydrogenase
VKVVRFHAPGDVRLEEAAEPTAGPDELKIRVRNCSTCGTDVKIFKFGHHHIVPPRVMGHEIAGEIIERGRDVEFLNVGDLVSVPFNIACGRCRNCREGKTGICLNVNRDRAGAAFGYVDMGGWPAAPIT